MFVAYTPSIISGIRMRIQAAAAETDESLPPQYLHTYMGVENGRSSFSSRTIGF
jgi:hypothetical protein